MADKPYRLLLVDDEPHVHLYLKTILDHPQIQVCADAHGGDEAIRLWTEQRPDLTLLDISMPRHTGIDVLTKVLETDPDARVVMLTSLSDFESVDTCIKRGAVGYIRKDTPPPKIRATVLATLGLQDTP